MTSAVGRLNDRLGAAAWPAPLRSLSWVDLAINTLLLLAAAALHALIPGGVPIPGGVSTGADPGNWLALAHEFRGRPVMSLDSWYPPLFPALLSSLLFVTSPLQALVVAGLIAQFGVVSASYWITRGLGRTRAGTVALLAGTAGYQLEAYAWGAFPQLLGSGLALLVLWIVVRLVDRPHAGWLVGAALGATAVVATHKLVAALLVVAVPVAAFHALWLRRRGEGTWAWKKAAPALIVLATLAVAGAAEWLSGSKVGYHPVLNPSSLSRLAVLYATVREATVPWALMALVGLWAISSRSWPAPLRPTVSCGSAWTLAGVGVFLITGEQRALLLSQLGLIMLMVAAFARWRSLIAQRQPRPRLAPAIFTIAAWAMVGSISLSGLISFSAAVEWYRFVDHAELQVLEQLKQASRPGDIVVAARGPKGSPTGWWVQGYAERPTYSSHDLRYLSFPEERRQAALANRLFQENLSRTELMSLLEDIGARYLVVDRRGPDGGWLLRTEDYGLVVAFDSPSLVVLRVPDPRT
ncbi:MAG: hypothetical protein ACRDXD_00970 [Acidimicrobiia bacterium]